VRCKPNDFNIKIKVKVFLWGRGSAPQRPYVVGAGLAPAHSFMHRATARIAPTSPPEIASAKKICPKKRMDFCPPPQGDIGKQENQRQKIKILTFMF
jgi:hypothetical protein